MSAWAVLSTAIVVAATMLVACGASPDDMAAKAAREQSARQREAARDAEARLIADPSAATEELARRLGENVRRSGELLIIRTKVLTPANLEGLIRASRDFTVTAMPGTAPWAVTCTQSGIDVVFGATLEGEVSEGSGSVMPGTFVSLTNTELTEQRCQALVVGVGEAVIRLLTQDQAASSHP
jgi:hypothetical protein